MMNFKYVRVQGKELAKRVSDEYDYDADYLVNT